MTPVRFISKGAIVTLHGSFMTVSVCRAISKEVAERNPQNECIICRNDRHYYIDSLATNISLDEIIESSIEHITSNIREL